MLWYRKQSNKKPNLLLSNNGNKPKVSSINTPKFKKKRKKIKQPIESNVTITEKDNKKSFVTNKKKKKKSRASII